jgi:hypothetical protein
MWKKGEFVPVHTMKPYDGIRDITLLILNLGTKCRRSLYSRGRILQYPLNRRLGGPQNRFGPRGEECIPEIEKRFLSLQLRA